MQFHFNLDIINIKLNRTSARTNRLCVAMHRPDNTARISHLLVKNREIYEKTTKGQPIGLT
jgi:hypothetical protein